MRKRQDFDGSTPDGRAALVEAEGSSDPERVDSLQSGTADGGEAKSALSTTSVPLDERPGGDHHSPSPAAPANLAGAPAEDDTPAGSDQPSVALEVELDGQRGVGGAGVTASGSAAVLARLEALDATADNTDAGTVVDNTATERLISEVEVAARAALSAESVEIEVLVPLEPTSDTGNDASEIGASEIDAKSKAAIETAPVEPAPAEADPVEPAPVAPTDEELGAPATGDDTAPTARPPERAVAAAEHGDPQPVAAQDVGEAVGDQVADDVADKAARAGDDRSGETQNHPDGDAASEPNAGTPVPASTAAAANGIDAAAAVNNTFASMAFIPNAVDPNAPGASAGQQPAPTSADRRSDNPADDGGTEASSWLDGSGELPVVAPPRSTAAVNAPQSAADTGHSSAGHAPDDQGGVGTDTETGPATREAPMTTPTGGAAKDEWIATTDDGLAAALVGGAATAGHATHATETQQAPVEHVPAGDAHDNNDHNRAVTVGTASVDIPSAQVASATAPGVGVGRVDLPGREESGREESGRDVVEGHDEHDVGPPVKGGHRWFRRQIRNYGPILGLIPMAVFGLFAWAGQQFWTDGAVAGLSVGLGAAAAPFLMIAGLPFGSSDSYRVAVIASIALWLAIGWWASRRALARPMPTWKTYFQQLGWLSAAVGGGVLMAYWVALRALG